MSENETRENELLSFLQKHADDNNIALNTNENIVSSIITSLVKKEKKTGHLYCPCRVPIGTDEEKQKIACPCVFHLDEVQNNGRCHCNLFIKKG